MLLIIFLLYLVKIVSLKSLITETLKNMNGAIKIGIYIDTRKYGHKTKSEDKQTKNYNTER